MPSPDTPSPDFTYKRAFLTPAEGDSLHAALTSQAPQIVLTDREQVHHLANVTRLRPGEYLVLVDPARRTATLAQAAEVSRRHILCDLKGPLPIPPDELPPTTLVLALIPEQRFKLSLEKACELGVHAIQPVFSERSVVKYEEEKRQEKCHRWEQLLRQAGEQSEAITLPTLHLPVSLSDWLHTLPPINKTTHRLLCLERGPDRMPLRNYWYQATQVPPPQVLQADSSWTFAIGPEGGWTPQEVQMFQDAGFTPISLTTRVLRCETAAMMALSQLHYNVHAL